MIKIFLILTFYTFLCINIFGQESNIFSIQNNTSINSLVSKKAGIGFRIDDNYNLNDYQTMASKFTPYPNYHFSVALNFADSYYYNNANVHFSDPSFISVVQELQAAGHEIMDHTPNHRTNYFITLFPIDTFYIENTTTFLPGIDQVIELPNGKRKVCLEFNDVIPSGQEDGICEVIGDSIYGNFSAIDFNTEPYIYLSGPGLDTLFFISGFSGNKQKAKIKDLWEEAVNFEEKEDVGFYKFTRKSRLTIDAIRELAKETQRLTVEYNLIRPYTWIQPGGRHPVISRAELSQALVPLGYTSGASFENVQSLKVFNEYDPNDVKMFGIQWEDFNEDHTDQNLSKIKTIISDGIAKHKVMFGHNHFYTLGTTGYVTSQQYFNNVEEILSWCDSNNIAVKTYSEWANLLYNETPDPYENVFPPLNVNLDTYTNTLNPNGIPDGYAARTTWTHNGNIIDDKGFWETDPGAPSEGNYCYAKYWNNNGRIFMVQNLGGIEKGENEFEIWTKGGQDDRIEVIFSFPNTTNSNQVFIIPANTSSWKKYNLSNSTNFNTLLNIPQDASLVSVEVKAQYFTGPIKVSGMALYKKKPIISAAL
ncbi:MAG: hypothetical protein KDC90_06235, partial [Ignavibacteriae bacterium]|nr:hypothetical protein [Ignavibacteriota bacterium]